MTDTARDEAIREENRKVRRLQFVVDLVTSVLWQSEIPLEEAQEMVSATRRYALQLFPDKELTYELLYQSRFDRLLREKFRII